LPLQPAIERSLRLLEQSNAIGEARFLCRGAEDARRAAEAKAAEDARLAAEAGKIEARRTEIAISWDNDDQGR
jgi:hypothetical protein